MQRHSHTFLLSFKGHTLWLFGILTFAAVHTLSSFFAQKRGIPVTHLPFSVLGFFCGITIPCLLLPTIEKFMPQTSRKALVGRCLVLLGMLLPAITSLLLQILGITPQSGTLFINFMQPMLWATLLPVASRLLFHPALNGMHAALMGISGALISIIWAIIPPLDQASKFVGEVPLDFFAQVYLPFINTARAMFCVVFAIIAWELFITYPNTQKTQENKVPLRKIMPFIWIMVPCFLLLGITEFVLNAPELSFSFSFYKLYANVALAGALLSFGLWVNKKGSHSLQWILAITLLLLPIAAMGLVLPFTPKAPSAITLLIGIKMQTFVCILACGLFSLRCNRPHIVIWLGLLTPALSMLSQLGMQKLAFILSEEMFGKILFVSLTLLAALCLAGLPFIARACQSMLEDLPLPDQQDFKDEEFTHEALQPRLYRSEKITEFAEKYRLSNREVQILEMLGQGLSSSEMADQINLRESTVRTYAQGLLRKTGAKSRLLLVAALAAEDDNPLEQQEPSLE